MQLAAVYSKIMLRTIELAESDYTFDGLATERNMPSNNGSNEIVFKRMLSLATHTQPLVEGIPPASDQGRMVAIKASTNQYGRYMEFTDKVDWAVVDPLISEYTRQLSLKIPELKDLLAQQALLSECQMFYACEKEVLDKDPDVLVPKTGAKEVTHVRFMSPDCAPTIDEFRKIVLSMEAAKVRPFQGSNFLCLCSSAVLFDLITDRRVKEFMKFAGNAQTYTNDMVVDLFSLAFKKAKTIKTDNTYTDADGNVVYLYHDASTKKNYVLLAPLSEHAKGDSTYTAVTGEKEVDIANRTTKAATTIPASVDILNIHYSFVVGEECLFRIGVEGHTSPQFINKGLGSAGTLDPLNQRQTIGWKIDSLGYKVPNPDAVVAYLSCPTQYKVNVNARPDLKNQFTDYKYGYMETATGRYFHPEQVAEAVVDGEVRYYVKGTNPVIWVESVTMTQLVKPVNGGRLDETTGKKQVVVGTLPTSAFALSTNHEVRFLKDQVVKHTDGKYYIKGLAGVAGALVVELPATFEIDYLKADGTGSETRTAVDEGISAYNKTGDPRID
jgi:N4-gp56 family major capsid protein